MNRKWLLALIAALISAILGSTAALAWNWPKPNPDRPGSHPPATSTSGGAHQVPEPGMLGLMGAGVAGLIFARRRRTAK